MCYGYHIWSKEVLMQAENDDDLDGGQRSSEVKWGKLCDMATIFGQKNWWCTLRMMMTFMEVKGHQRSNMVTCAMAQRPTRGQLQWITFMYYLWYLVSRWGLGPKVCMHHFGCGMNWIKGYYMIVNEKKWNLLIFNLFSGNTFLNIVILYYLLMRRDVWFANHLVLSTLSISILLLLALVVVTMEVLSFKLDLWLFSAILLFTVTFTSLFTLLIFSLPLEFLFVHSSLELHFL